MKRLWLATLILSSALAAVIAGAALPAAPAGPATATCEQISLRVGSGTEDGYRVVLGNVSIPDEQSTSRATTRRNGKSWPYFREVGLLVRGGASPVTVSVPEGWRKRIAISSGNTPATSSLQIASCRASDSNPWNAHAVGFHLSSRADCVPLDIRVGGLSTSVRLGVGRACGATHRKG
jgi:hypothetical protein